MQINSLHKSWYIIYISQQSIYHPAPNPQTPTPPHPPLSPTPTHHTRRCQSTLDQTTSRYLHQCWPRCMSSFGITRPQYHNSVNILNTYYIVLYQTLIFTDHTLWYNWKIFVTSEWVMMMVTMHNVILCHKPKMMHKIEKINKQHIWTDISNGEGYVW